MCCLAEDLQVAPSQQRVGEANNIRFRRSRTHDCNNLVLFLRFDVEICTIISTTSATASITARIRRPVSAGGHFPTEQAQLRCLR